jgi:cytochrome b pre-mRNA-processing protein 3
LHTFFLIDRLSHPSSEERPTKPLIDKICQLMMADFDRSLREMGVGDFSIGRKMRSMGEAYTGRFRIYQEAFAALPAPDSPLPPPHQMMLVVQALTRNVYRSEAGDHPFAPLLAAYVVAQRKTLYNQPLDRFRQGMVSFLSPEKACSGLVTPSERALEDA